MRFVFEYFSLRFLIDFEVEDRPINQCNLCYLCEVIVIVCSTLVAGRIFFGARQKVSVIVEGAKFLPPHAAQTALLCTQR